MKEGERIKGKKYIWYKDEKNMAIIRRKGGGTIGGGGQRGGWGPWKETLPGAMVPVGAARKWFFVELYT